MTDSAIKIIQEALEEGMIASSQDSTCRFFPECRMEGCPSCARERWDTRQRFAQAFEALDTLQLATSRLAAPPETKPCPVHTCDCDTRCPHDCVCPTCRSEWIAAQVEKGDLRVEGHCNTCSGEVYIDLDKSNALDGAVYVHTCEDE